MELCENAAESLESYLRPPLSEQDAVRANRTAWRRHRIVTAIAATGAKGLSQSQLRERGLNFGAAGIARDLKALCLEHVLRALPDPLLLDVLYCIHPDADLRF